MVDDAVERMREAGRKYLREHPKAFGGGIEPSTGIKYVGGKRVSVKAPIEIKPIAKVPILTPQKKPLGKIDVLRTGGVRVGKVTYHSGAIVPFSGGKTANQLQLKIFKLARKQGIKRRGTYSATIPITPRALLLKKRIVKAPPIPISRYVPPNIPRTGTGKLTRAIDVGRGEMQDYVFKYSNGRIISRTPIGRKLSQTERFKERQRLEITTKAIKEIKKPSNNIFLKTADFISGGYLTERKINENQEKLNKDVIDFNKQFGDRELSESEFKRAKIISQSIEKRESSLKKQRDDLAKSLKSRIARTLKPFEAGRRTSAEIEAQVKRNKPKIKIEESKLEEVENKIRIESKKKGIVAKIHLTRLKNIKKETKEEIQRLKEGRWRKILIGEMPIVPVINVPSGVTTIRFLGAQKIKGNKIITDLVFKTSKGRVGVAKGVTITKGKEGASVVLGRSGKMSLKIPFVKKKIIDVRSFIGREKVITTPTKVMLKTQIDLLKKQRNIGTITKIKKNIDALQQRGIGQVASVKGLKFMKHLKKVKGIVLDDFASISAVFTKNELSLIIGKSITKAGAKARFIGLIKGVSQKGKVFSISDKQQFAKGLKQVVSATAGALAKTQKISGLTKSANLITASRIAVETAKAKARITPKVKPISPKVKVTPTIIKPKVAPPKITIPKVKARVRGKVKPIIKPKVAPPKPITKQKQRVLQKQKQRLIQGAKQLRKQRAIKKQKLKQATTQRQRLRLKQAMRQTQKQINKIAQKLRIIRGVAPPKIPRIPLPVKIKFKKKRIKPTKKPKKKKQAYNVYARPRKRSPIDKKLIKYKRKLIKIYEKRGDKFSLDLAKGHRRNIKELLKKKIKRPKLIKVNKVPLKKSTAKNLRNYVTDTSLSRTARIKKTKGKPKTSRLRIPRGYAKRTSRKFRRYKIVKGRRKPLPKGAVIEKRKYLLDTKREKRQITLRRRIAQITKPRRRITSRKIKRKVRGIKRSPPIKKSIRKPVRRLKQTRTTRVTRTKQSTKQVNSQNRAVMLKNLEKARKIRMSNLKKRKR